MTAPYTGIRDLCLAWPAGQKQTVTVECDLAPGRVMSDWSSFVLTIREDPEWPRSGADLTVPLDPAVAGGTPAVTSTGTVVGNTAVFTFNVPNYPGINRYAMDVWGVGGTAGPTQFYDTTWLTVLPSTR